MSVKSKILTLIEKAVTDKWLTEFENGDVQKEHLFAYADTITAQLTRSNIENLESTMSSIGLSGLNGSTRIQDVIVFLILTHDSIQALVDIADYGFEKWQEVEDNDWGWFASQIKNTSWLGQDEVYYLLRSRVQTGDLEMNAYSTICAPNKDMLTLLQVMHSQSFLSGMTYDDSEECFVAGDVKVTEDEARELSETEYNLLSTIHKRYSSIEQLGMLCDPVAVSDGLSYYS